MTYWVSSERLHRYSRRSVDLRHGGLSLRYLYRICPRVKRRNREREDISDSNNKVMTSIPSTLRILEVSGVSRSPDRLGLRIQMFCEGWYRAR